MDPLERLLCAIGKALALDSSVELMNGSVICISNSIAQIEIQPDVILANENFIAKCSDEELVFVCRHEGKHLSKNHGKRRVQIMQAIREGRILTSEARIRFTHQNVTKWILLHAIWNVAADLEINAELKVCPELHQLKGLCIGYRDFKTFPVTGSTAEDHFDVLCNRSEWTETTIEILKAQGYGYADYE